MDKISAAQLWRIEPYTPAFASRWDEMAAASRNATFLHRRGYMDYHADRFDDASMVALLRGEPTALLPACRSDATLWSHRGLTYGGWLLPPDRVSAADMLCLFEAWLAHCRREGYRTVIYTPVPHIYSRRPSQEDIYALWRYGAATESVLISSAIRLADNPGFDKRRRRYLDRVARSGVTVAELSDPAPYWRLLEECLGSRHDAAPTHTLAEMRLLMSRFPSEIRLWGLSDAGGLQAGILLYLTGTTAHCQYIATSPTARERRYLPYLVKHIIASLPAGTLYFDLGTSNEEAGRVLNAGLLDNKFGLGAGGVACPKYRIDL